MDTGQYINGQVQNGLEQNYKLITRRNIGSIQTGMKQTET